MHGKQGAAGLLNQASVLTLRGTDFNGGGRSVRTHFHSTTLIRGLTRVGIKNSIRQLIGLFIVHGNEKLSRLD